MRGETPSTKLQPPEKLQAPNINHAGKLSAIRVRSRSDPDLTPTSPRLPWLPVAGGVTWKEVVNHGAFCKIRHGSIDERACEMVLGTSVEAAHHQASWLGPCVCGYGSIGSCGRLLPLWETEGQAAFVEGC